MAIKLSANYSKKLGLPQYSSHSFSASIETELSDITQAEAEISRLYTLLQQSVDQEIQNPGFMPASSETPARSPGHGRSNGNTLRPSSNGIGGDRWNCTEGQRGFILRIINENQLQKQDAEDLSQQLFGIGVRELNKMQASQLIEELLAKVGKPAPRQGRWAPSNPQRQAA